MLLWPLFRHRRQNEKKKKEMCMLQDEIKLRSI